MSTVAFIARDASGTNQHGTSAEGSPSVISTSSAKDISLNLQPSDVESYSRRGTDLFVTLADGTVVELDGFYSTAGTGPKSLFLSDQGDFIEVVLEDKPSGMLFASYEPIDLSGKWSAYDDMVFLDVDRVEPVVAPLAAPFLGGLGGLGAAAAGAAVIAGGGGSGGGDAIVPTVNDADGTYEVPEGDPDGVTISGTGEAGSDVEVTIGDVVVTTTVEDDGTWSVNIPTEDLPDDGVYETVVDVVAPDGTTYDDLDGPTIDIDTDAPTVIITEGTQSVGDIVSGDEQASGTVITGTGEAGASVTLEIDGETQTTTVAEDGTWSVTFTSTQISTGEYETDITITTTDAHGNSTVSTDVLEVDTETSVTIDTGLAGGDDIINVAEAAAGVEITGTAEAGATVVVTVEGTSRTTTATDDGTWTVTYESGSLPSGEYDAAISVTSTDAVGNTATSSSTIALSTSAPALVITEGTQSVGDIVDGTEQSSGTVISGTGTVGGTVTLEIDGETQSAVVDEDGTWSVTFTSAQISTGEYETGVSGTITDANGNTTSVTDILEVDTETSVTIDSGLAGGDDVLNASESASDLEVTGTAEAGATVEVELEGVTQTTTAGTDGTWTVTYAAGTIPDGEYDATISVTSTDEAGNSATATSTLTVDTDAGFVQLDEDPIETDDIINATERSDGVTITGTATAGETVTVMLGSASGTTVADADGNWSYDFAASEIPTGTDTLDVTASITDDHGNTETDSDTVGLDTEVVPFTFDADPTGDGVINLDELTDGFTLSGTVEIGSTVVVTIEGTEYDATVDDSGNWTLDLDSDDIPAGNRTIEAVVTATDPAGNVATSTDDLGTELTFSVDTEYNTPVITGTSTDGVDNITRIEVSETSGDTFSVNTLESGGAAPQADFSTADLGSELLLSFDTPIADGTNLVVSSEDDAGNTSSTVVMFEDNATETSVLDHASISDFNVDRINLEFADQVNLTLTEDDINALSGNSDTLTILGGSDDTVTLTGATAAGTQTVDGETFDVYTIGDGDTTLLVEDDVNVII